MPKQTESLNIHAFADFEGVTKRNVYDRMAAVVLGTIGKGHHWKGRKCKPCE